MNKPAVLNKMSNNLSKVGFKIKKHSPEILIVAGIAGTVASTVMACKATTKISSILDEAKGTLESIKECSANPEMETKYSPEDAKKDITITYIQTGAKIVKLYAPAIILGTLSIAGIITSHNILRKRNIALAAAYTAIDTSFKEYRSRVVSRFGEEVDRELKYNGKKVKIEETIIDENGKEKKVKSTVDVVNINEVSDYARYFDNQCSGWERNDDYNQTFLSMQQRYANQKLKSQGRMFLNEVYEMLGIEWSKAGQVVGWVYDDKNDVGDNRIDFMAREVYRALPNDENQFEKVTLLDFNVDGNIWDLM